MNTPEISRKLGCILVKGALPINLMMELSDEAGKGAIIDGDAARMAKVDFAFGLPEYLNKLKEELAEEAQGVMRSASPGWQDIINHFDELEALFKEETAGQEQWHAPMTYDRMKCILKASENKSSTIAN